MDIIKLLTKTTSYIAYYDIMVSYSSSYICANCRCPRLWTYCMIARRDSQRNIRMMYMCTNKIAMLLLYTTETGPIKFEIELLPIFYGCCISFCKTENPANKPFVCDCIMKKSLHFHGGKHIKYLGNSVSV